MNKLIHVVLVAYLITVEGRLNYPLTFNAVNDDTNAVPQDAKVNASYLLPTTVKPSHYSLELTPYFDVEDKLKAFTFDGVVSITFEIMEDVFDITFHSRNLTFKTPIQLLHDNKKIDVSLKPENEEDLKRDFRVITSKKKLEKGSYLLRIEYSGILHDDMRGFYRSSYKNNDQKTVWLAATHFEPVGARRAFPCFDEPTYKAIFEVSITHNSTYTAISNGVRQETNNKKVSKFEKTPIMSTYLLAIVVSDFESKDNGNQNFTVYAKPNTTKHADLAIEKGEKLLNALEDYTNIPFEIKKMDQAAIPDFSAGAMENWGLVLYREKSLLFDANEMTTSEKQNIVETIAHEFAHQWFGDLVSPKWWKYLWLNEGFANFFQALITEKVIPEWRSVDQAVVKSIQTTAFEFDSGASTHPMNEVVETPKEIQALFDNISYAKAGAVIRMIQHFLTEKVFRNGLTRYLKENQHRAADSDDLFKALQSETTDNNIDVKKILDTWVNFKGYPVVTVTRNYEKNGTVTLHQDRFLTYDPKIEDQYNHTWSIPINYATEQKPEFNKTSADLWFDSQETIITVDVEPNQWLIINKLQTGYYRVNYDEQNWNLIIKSLNSSKRDQIHVLNRAQLINDALAFVKQNKLNLKILLHLTAYLRNEIDYIAWYPAFKTFSWLNNKLINTEYHQIFKEYVVSTTKSIIESVGFDESKDSTDEKTHLTKFNRIAAINLACSVGAEQCTRQLNVNFEKWLNDSTNNPIRPNLKSATLCHGLRIANMEIWNKTLDLCINSSNVEEKRYLTSALGCSNNKTILQYYLNFTGQDDSPISDFVTVIKSISENSDVGINLVLDFVTERFITLYRKIKNEDSISNLITSIGQKITTQEQLNKLKATAKKDIHEKFTKGAIDAAENNVKWIKNNKDILVSWTKEQQGNGVTIISASLSLICALLVLIPTITS